MVIYFDYVEWSWIGGLGCREGVGYACGWVFVSGGVKNGSFHQIGIGVCCVWGEVVGGDILFP